MSLFIATLFAALAFLSLSLLKAYGYLPARELKARARTGDKVATLLWRARAYESSLAVVLWLIGGAASALFFWQLGQHAPWWLAIVAGSLFFWVGFAWLPARQVSNVSLRVAAFVAPIFAWALEHLHKLINPIVRLVHHRWPASTHTGLYDIDDLLDVIQEQYGQSDNRIDQTSLSIAAHALTFGHRQVSEIMTAKHSVKSVSAEDVIGPVLMTELHGSGQAYFPVYEDKPDHIIGSLSLRDLVDAKATGPVKDRMVKEAYYLHEEQPLADTLENILQPNRHLFVVLNDAEEYVGVVTTEEILRQIIGQPVPEEPEPNEEQVEQPEEEGENPTEPSTEVVE